MSHSFLQRKKRRVTFNKNVDCAKKMCIRFEERIVIATGNIQSENMAAKRYIA